MVFWAVRIPANHTDWRSLRKKFTNTRSSQTEDGETFPFAAEADVCTNTIHKANHLYTIRITIHNNTILMTNTTREAVFEFLRADTHNIHHHHHPMFRPRFRRPDGACGIHIPTKKTKRGKINILYVNINA